MNQAIEPKPMPLCTVCHVNRVKMRHESRCEDCWSNAATRWKWRGELPLAIRQARAKAEEADDEKL